MDYMYDFKQSQIDRLEDAGVKDYNPKDGYRVFRNHGQRLSLKKARMALSAIFSLFV